jgi:hypothetical protein
MEETLKHIEEKIRDINFKMERIHELTPQEGGVKNTSDTYQRITGYVRNVSAYN